MKRSKSSQQWLKRHFNDPYVIAAQKAGYRSRAAFKLLEMQEKDRLLIPGRVVVDLGATPGGWSQIAVPLVGKHGVVIALDVLAMEPLEGVTFLQGDFTEPAVLEQLLAAINGRQVDLVMSDMSPNISGMKVVDQPRTMYLAELALDFAKGVLKAKGDFVTKIFQGEGFDAYVKELRGYFEKVVIRKPKASRAESREVYIIAKGFKAHASQ